jgi:hypothetical protein
VLTMLLSVYLNFTMVKLVVSMAQLFSFVRCALTNVAAFKSHAFLHPCRLQHSDVQLYIFECETTL